MGSLYQEGLANGGVGFASGLESTWNSFFRAFGFRYKYIGKEKRYADFVIYFTANKFFYVEVKPQQEPAEYDLPWAEKDKIPPGCRLFQHDGFVKAAVERFNDHGVKHGFIAWGRDDFIWVKDGRLIGPIPFKMLTSIAALEMAVKHSRSVYDLPDLPGPLCDMNWTAFQWTLFRKPDEELRKRIGELALASFYEFCTRLKDGDDGAKMQNEKERDCLASLRMAECVDPLDDFVKRHCVRGETLFVEIKRFCEFFNFVYMDKSLFRGRFKKTQEHIRVALKEMYGVKSSNVNGTRCFGGISLKVTP